VGPRAGLDTEARGKILCPCRGVTAVNKYTRQNPILTKVI